MKKLENFCYTKNRSNYITAYIILFFLLYSSNPLFNSDNDIPFFTNTHVTPKNRLLLVKFNFF